MLGADQHRLLVGSARAFHRPHRALAAGSTKSPCEVAAARRCRASGYCGGLRPRCSRIAERGRSGRLAASSRGFRVLLLFALRDSDHQRSLNRPAIDSRNIFRRKRNNARAQISSATTTSRAITEILSGARRKEHNCILVTHPKARRQVLFASRRNGRARETRVIVVQPIQSKRCAPSARQPRLSMIP
jgi:hypothetical protein